MAHRGISYDIEPKSIVILTHNCFLALHSLDSHLRIILDAATVVTTGFGDIFAEVTLDAAIAPIFFSLLQAKGERVLAAAT
jgi:hypothetical protein